MSKQQAKQSTQNSKEQAPVIKANTSKNQANDETATEKMSDRVRSFRFTGLGLLDLARSQSQSIFDEIQARAKSELNESTETSENDEDAEKGAEKTAGQRIGLNYKQISAYGKGVIDQLTDETQSFRQWINETVDEVTKDVKKDSESSMSISQYPELTTQFFKRVTDEARSLSSQTFDDAKRRGKSVDYEIRKEITDNRQQLEEQVQKLWQNLGLVSKREFEEVNRKLVLLSKALEEQSEGKPPQNTLVYLDRRGNDRRVKQVAVEFDQRIKQRRTSDQSR